MAPGAIAALLTAILPAVVLGQTTFQEIRDSVAVPGSSVEWVQGSLLLADNAAPAECVIAIVSRGVSHSVYTSPAWRSFSARERCPLLHFEITGVARSSSAAVDQQVIRNAALGGAEGLLGLLDRLALKSRRPELSTVPLVLWGFSAAGSFAITFGALQPARTLAVIRYHSHLRELAVDPAALAAVPTLIMAGQNDQVAGTADAEAFWRSGLELHAPWMLIIEPGAEHFVEGDDFASASSAMLSWLQTILHVRR